MMESNPLFSFPSIYRGANIVEYNQAIKEAATSTGCKYVDLYSFDIPYDSMDGIHPTAKGMDTIASLIIQSVTGQEVHRFVQGNFEYIRLKYNDTTQGFYPNSLSLYDVKNNKEITFQEETIKLGSSKYCSLNLKNDKISSEQAIFEYFEGSWYLTDNNSTTGTWINDLKLLPNRKYLLYQNDVIDLSHEIKFVFFKCEKMDDLTTNMKLFAQFNRTDVQSLKNIIQLLSDAYLYFPFEINVNSIFQNVDVTKLKPGDKFKTANETKMKLIESKDGYEFIPAFIKSDDIYNELHCSAVRLYFPEYVPYFIQMNKQVIINMYDEYLFQLPVEIMRDYLIPLIEMRKSKEKFKKNYEFVRLIEQGQYTKVYLVNDKRLNKQWAVKIIDKNYEKKESLAISMIMNEVEFLMKKDHPCFPKIVDKIEDEENICIVMDYVKGKTLADIVKEQGPQPEKMVIDWAKQLCDMLDYLHSFNPPYIYRDMKPSNVILTDSGGLKLIDFDIVCQYNPKMNDEYLAGTKEFTPSEQFIGKTEPCSDIYALGITIHTLVTG